jgi:hypothetical protein
MPAEDARAGSALPLDLIIGDHAAFIAAYLTAIGPRRFYERTRRGGSGGEPDAVAAWSAAEECRNRDSRGGSNDANRRGGVMPEVGRF